MNIDTRCVHAGWEPEDGGPRQIPIYQNTTWYFDSTEHMAKLFDLEEAGYFYTRLANPTNDAVAARIAALEGGVAAVLTSSGQAASFFSIFNICSEGDHLVTSSALYGGTYNLFAITLPKMGIEVSFVDPDATGEQLREAIRPNTKCVFAETVSNPALNVLDIEKFATLAHDAGVPLIVDNTFPTPVNCRPFEWGADIVIHSTTKYLDGHGTVVGGAIVDSGNFDWDAHAEAFPGLTTPDDSYHGVTYTERFGKGAYITKIVAQLMRDLGSIPSPNNSFILGVNIESLPLRMAKHVDNAQKIAEWLEKRDGVAIVRYPGLPSDPYHALAKKYLDADGGCGVIAFDLKGSAEQATTFLDALKVISIATHVADARSCVLHPASSTHRQLTDEQLVSAGVTPTLIRLSVGIEDADDLIADLDQALSSVL
ncbi:MAG: O-acetylhomoserine aminocarboxypropyltransferase/cysteine synthase [Coriobacteriia bacterium]|nr:O-acetylhomoserine aminocarboxypropyltransferase/cysteine synthase [Coriobacteriia bacterium]